MPRGCRVYKIQSSVLPSMVVKKANNGEECAGFSPRITKESKTIDLNNSKYW